MLRAAVEGLRERIRRVREVDDGGEVLAPIDPLHAAGDAGQGGNAIAR